MIRTPAGPLGWAVRYLPEVDALRVRVEGSGTENVMYVPAASLDFIVGTECPEDLYGFTLYGWSTGFTPGWPFLERTLGANLASAVYQLREHSEFNNATVPADSNAKRVSMMIEAEPPGPAADQFRTSYLYRMVNEANWDMEGNMNLGSTLTEILRQADVDGSSHESLDDLLSDCATGGMDGKAARWLRERRQQAGTKVSVGGVNIVPRTDDSDGPCQPVLLALCFTSDNLRAVLDEAIIHASVRCKGTRLVVVVTTKWDPASWTAVAPDVALVDAAFVVFVRGPQGELARIL